ncbi:MAG TPA: hypothetical protein VGP62_04000 [Bryobacteraceae bacterium]|jgi:hypothetical protein|nr:hypothetical protein [Bryobacteraceae bacterium]
MPNASGTGSAALPLPAAAPERHLLERTLAGWLQASHMSHLGIANTMRLARAVNRIKFRRQDRWRRELYCNELAALFEENGGLTRPAIQLNDGWAVDTSLALPHLDRVLEDSEKIIAERCGARLSGDPYRSYFQDVWKTEDLEQYPSMLDFATSSDVLATVTNYLKCIPALSTTLPPGIRFVESNAAFDDQPGTPKDSQLYHIDYYSLPNVYVIVLLRDATPEHGPWTFLPRSVSQKTAKALGYWGRRRGYRVSDEDIYSVADRKDVIEFCYPRGTVLFIESSGCFHYGSRNSVKPRFQLMLGYTGACRSDFSERILPPKVYPTRSTDSRLRRMVLNKNMLGIS